MFSGWQGTVANDRRRLNRGFACLDRVGGRAEDRPLPHMILMTDDRPGADWVGAVCRLPPGSAVIVRHPKPDGRRKLVAALGDVARRRRVLLLCAMERPMDIDGIDGVHIPERGLHRWRRVDIARAGHMFVTASAHSAAAVGRAVRLGVDAVLLSPVFPTRSHREARALGLMRFEGMARRSPAPVFALGGIDTANVRRIGRGAAAGMAAIGYFLDAGRARKSGGFRSIGV